MKTSNSIWCTLCAAVATVFSSCAGENLNLIGEDMVQVEVKDAVADATTSVDNNEGSSSITFDITSTIVTTEDEIKNGVATAYATVELGQTEILVNKFDELSMVSEEEVSANDFSEGFTFGKDIIKRFTFSDGQVATVKYGWRYNQMYIGGANVNAPHIEITGVTYKTYSDDVDGDRRKLTPAFDFTYVKVNSREADQTTVTAEPWYYEVRTTADCTLDYTYNVNNKQQFGSIVFGTMTSTVTLGDLSENFNVSAYANVDLAKGIIEVESFEPISMTKEETITDNDINDGTTLGKDMVKKYTFSDGQVATVSYGWRYEVKEIDGIAFTAPHVELDPVVYTTYKDNTTGNERQVIPAFDFTCVNKNSTEAKTEIITVEPWYLENKKEENHNQTKLRLEVEWNKENSDYLNAMVIETANGTETVVAARAFKFLAGLKRDCKWDVCDTSVSYKTDVKTGEKSAPATFEEWSWTSQEVAYKYEPTYHIDGGYFTPDFTIKVYNFEGNVNIDGKEFNFKITGKLDFQHEIVNLPERAAKYDPSEYKYLGSDKQTFVYTEVNTNKVVMTHVSYNDLVTPVE